MKKPFFPKKFLLGLAIVLALDPSYGASLRNIAADTTDGIYSTRNFAKNPSFEGPSSASTVSQWTASAGTLTTTTTAANIDPSAGLKAGSWAATGGAGRTLDSSSITITAADGLNGQNGVVSCKFKAASGTATHTLTVYDGSTNIVTPTTITSSTTGFARTSVNFIFPASGTVKLRISSVSASEPTLYIDSCFFGLAEGFNLGSVSQATLVGTVTVTGCASQWTTTSATFADLGTQTGCTYTTTGSITAPGTNLAGFQVPVSTGEYFLVYDGQWGTFNTGTQACTLRVSDGTTAWRENPTVDQTLVGVRVLPSTFTSSNGYTSSQGTMTLRIQGKISTANNCGLTGTTANPGVFKLYRFPTSAETAYRPDIVAWKGKASFATNVAGFVASTTSSTVVNLNNAAFGTVSYGTNASAPTVANDLAVKFNNIPAGSYTAYIQAPMTAYGTGVSSSNCEWSLYDGTNRVGLTQVQLVSVVGLTNRNTIGAMQGEVTYTSLQSSKEWSLQVRKISTSGTSDCRVEYNDTGGSIEIGLIPRTQNIPAPILVGSVTSNSSGAERVERANLNCDASSAITAQSGTWVSSIGNASAGACAVTLVTGMFSATPSCVASSSTSSGGDPLILGVTASSATAVSVDCSDNTGADCSAYDFEIHCMGPR